MNVKEAVRLAKAYVADLYEAENISNLGLEEVYAESGDWIVTLGFSRPWDRNAVGLAAIAQQLSAPPRSYKTVRIDDVNGTVTALRNRDVA
jgi:hypothetical protein